jgi:NADH-quinone oxidoreductase subunit N
VAGLFAKVVVLRAAVHGHVTWLAVVAAVNTVIGLAYYLRVAALLFAGAGDRVEAVEPAAAPGTARRSAAFAAALAVTVVVTVALSVDPQPLLHWASDAAALAAR